MQDHVPSYRAVAHNLLERVDQYLWSPRPTALAPQLLTVQHSEIGGVQHHEVGSVRVISYVLTRYPHKLLLYPPSASSVFPAAPHKVLLYCEYVNIVGRVIVYNSSTLLFVNFVWP